MRQRGEFDFNRVGCCCRQSCRRIGNLNGLDLKQTRDCSMLKWKMNQYSKESEKEKKTFFLFLPRSFHFHPFIHFFLSCLRNEIPDDIFSFSFQWDGIKVYFWSHHLHRIRSIQISEMKNWNRKIQKKKMSETFATKVFFLSVSFFIFEAFFKVSFYDWEKKFHVFSEMSQLASDDIWNDKNVSMMVNSSKKKYSYRFPS